MARARSIKPALFKNELLGVEDPMVTLLFIGLWSLADREGKLEDRPLRIKAEIFPYRECQDFNGYLTVLERLEFICRYSVKNQQIIKINNFKKHQSPHKTEKASELPDQEVNQEKSAFKPLKSRVTVKVPLNNDGLTEALPPESLFTDSCLLTPDPLINKPSISSKSPNDNLISQEEVQQEKVQDINSGYAFHGDVIKLNQKDFNAWKLLYSNVNLHEELTQLDMELRGEKKWFQMASAKLNYRNNVRTNKLHPQRKKPVTENFENKDYGETQIPEWMQGAES